MKAPDDAALGLRDTVTVTGTDAGEFLQSQVSQDLAPLAIGDTAWTLVLAPNGKVVSLARVTRVDADTYVLDTDAGFGQVLADRLGRFKIRVDAEIELQRADGDNSANDDPASGDRANGDEAARIAAGWPRLGREIIPDETVPAGLGLNEIAVSFTKGCYPGQELVERMDSRGAEAPRQLRVVEVAAGAQPGDSVVSGTGENIGVLTSVAGTQALAWIQRGSVDEAVNP